MDIKLCVIWKELWTARVQSFLSPASLYQPTNRIKLLSPFPAAIQRVRPRTHTTAHCPQPEGKNWPRSDRGSWPMQCTTSGRRVKTSLRSDTFTLGSGRAVRNTTTVSGTCPVATMTVALVVLCHLFGYLVSKLFSFSISFHFAFRGEMS